MQQVIASPAVQGELFDSTSHLSSPEQLRDDLEKRGYVFIRGLFPLEELLNVRRDIAGVLQRNGWLDPAVDPMLALSGDGVGPYAESVHPEYAPVYDQIQHLESFHTLPHDPRLVQLFRDLFNGEPLIHPRHITRVVFPNAVEETTPPHQDYIYILGTNNTLTAWFPVGDCPRELGGLAVLEGSHQQGLLPTVAARGAGSRGILLENSGQKWVSTDFRAGDVLVFLALTVHSGLPNLTRNRLRLSMDIRTSPVAEPVHPSSLLPHMNRVTWDQIYAGWKSDRYKRYWERLNLILSSEDPLADR